MGTRAAEFERARVYSPEHVLLPDISYESFTYPGDQEALAALKKVPGAATILAYLQEHFTEQMVAVQNNEQMLKAGPRSYKTIYRLLSRCAEVMSIAVPDLYITSNPVMNAYTVGHRKTCIVLHSSIIENLTAEELCFVLGHELGHVKCGHGLYRQLGDLLVTYWDAAASQIPIPGLGLLRVPLLIAYWEWYRRAEFTCDRAGLLCIQNVMPTMGALSKLAGKVSGFEDEIDFDTAIAQSHAIKDVNKLVQVISILQNMSNTHPFVPARLREVKTFADSPEYRRILSGQYARDHRHTHEGGTRIECPGCKRKINSTLNFCPDCGRPVGAKAPATPEPDALCHNCGRPIGRDILWCTACGAEQKQNAAPRGKPPVSGLDKIKEGFEKLF